MILSRDLASSSFHIPRRVLLDLCLNIATLGIQPGSAASPTIYIVDRIPSHDSNCAVSGILRLVFMVKRPFNLQ
jgi:hypothetical protein